MREFILANFNIFVWTYFHGCQTYVMSSMIVAVEKQVFKKITEDVLAESVQFALICN